MRASIMRSWSATETLLRAVVEVALQPPPLGVAGGDDALARGPQLRELMLRRRPQPRIVERDRAPTDLAAAGFDQPVLPTEVAWTCLRSGCGATSPAVREPAGVSVRRGR
jgi:hypothetical protein